MDWCCVQAAGTYWRGPCLASQCPDDDRLCRLLAAPLKRVAQCRCRACPSRSLRPRRLPCCPWCLPAQHAPPPLCPSPQLQQAERKGAAAAPAGRVPEGEGGLNARGAGGGGLHRGRGHAAGAEQRAGASSVQGAGTAWAFVRACWWLRHAGRRTALVWCGVWWTGGQVEVEVCGSALQQPAGMCFWGHGQASAESSGVPPRRCCPPPPCGAPCLTTLSPPPTHHPPPLKPGNLQRLRASRPRARVPRVRPAAPRAGGRHGQALHGGAHRRGVRGHEGGWKLPGGRDRGGADARCVRSDPEQRGALRAATPTARALPTISSRPPSPRRRCATWGTAPATSSPPSSAW